MNKNLFDFQGGTDDGGPFITVDEETGSIVDAKGGVETLEEPEDTFEIEVDDDSDTVVTDNGEDAGAEEPTDAEETEGGEEEEEPTGTGKEDEVDAEVEAVAARIEALQKYSGVELTEEELENLESEDNIAQAILAKHTNNVLNSVLSTMNEAEREITELLFTGATVEDIMDALTTVEYNYSPDDIEESVELQERLITDSLKAKGFSDAKIKRMLSKYEDDERYEDALDSLKELKATSSKDTKRKSIKERREQERAAKQEQARVFNESVTKAAEEFFEKNDEVIPGKKMRADRRKNLAKKVIPTAEKLLQNLPKYGPILAALDEYGILDGNWSAVTAPKKSDVTRKLIDTIKKTTPKKGANAKKSEDDDAEAIDRMIRRLKNR